MDKIEERIAELKAERDQFVQQANQQIAFLNGQIHALEELLKPEAEPEAEPEGEEGG